MCIGADKDFYKELFIDKYPAFAYGSLAVDLNFELLSAKIRDKAEIRENKFLNAQLNFPLKFRISSFQNLLYGR